MYRGIARRAVALAVAAASGRTSLKLAGARGSDASDIRWWIASAALIDDGLDPQIRRLARDLDALVDRGGDLVPDTGRP